MLWIESRRAIVAGDTLIDRGRGFEFPADYVDGAWSGLSYVSAALTPA